MRNGILAALVAVVAPQMMSAHRHAELSAEAMIDAIAAVESGNNPRAVGKLGERGRCQFMPATWRKYTNAPLLRAATDDAFTRKIERAHLAYLVGYFAQRGTTFDPTLIAAAWRHGEARAFANIRDDAAQRAANLYYDEIARRATR